MPSRLTASPSLRSRTSRTKPLVAIRLAEFAARKSRRLAIVIRPKACCDRGHDVRESLPGRRVSPSASGSRGAARARDCSAEKCASSFIPRVQTKEAAPLGSPALRRCLCVATAKVNSSLGLRAQFGALPRTLAHPPVYRLADFWPFALEADVPSLCPQRIAQCQTEADREHNNPARPRQRRYQRGKNHQDTAKAQRAHPDNWILPKLLKPVAPSHVPLSGA